MKNKSNSELGALKRSVGKSPFQSRLQLDSGGFCACPFHTGDSNKSMHLYQEDGVWAATCFSQCKQENATGPGKATWGPIDFVMKFDGVDKAEAIRRLGGKMKTGKEIETVEVEETPKPKEKAMSAAEFAKWGRDLTPEDVERFIKSRKNKGHTANFETWQRLGCRVGRASMKINDEWREVDALGFPYVHPSGEFLYTLKLRALDSKDFSASNAAASDGFFNLDAVNPLEPVFIVEGEPDVAVLAEMGYTAVSVITGSQTKFDKFAIEIISDAPEIYIVGDQDIPKRGKSPDPGQGCMDKIEAALAKFAHKVFRMRFAVDGTEREKELKDVSALRAHYGEEAFGKRFTELQTQAREWTWIDENIPAVSEISTAPQKWLIDRMIPYGCLTVLYGEKGAAKSLFSLFMAKYLSAPMPKQFLGRQIAGEAAVRGWETEGEEEDFTESEFCAPVPVLYLDRENPRATIGERRGKIGLLARKEFKYWGDWLSQERLSADPEKIDPCGPDDPRLLKWAARTRGFIVFDSLQQWYGDLNENSNGEMAQLMNKFKALARRCAGVLILHHMAKPAADGPRQKDGRGAGVITSIPEMSMCLEKLDVDGEEILRLGPGRFRCCAPWQLDFKINWNADGNGSYSIWPVSDKLKSELSKQAAGKKAAKKSAKQEKVSEEAEKVGKFVRANPGASARKIAEETGINRDQVTKLAALADCEKRADGKWYAKAEDLITEEAPF
jgi:hypothetical protein